MPINKGFATRARGNLVILGAIALSLITANTGRAQTYRDGIATQIALSQPLTIRWRYDSNLTLNLTPASDNQNIYLPLPGGIVVSLNANNGELSWRSEIGGELSASPVADDHGVYVASEIAQSERADGSPGVKTGTLRALGREGGVTLWMRNLTVPLLGSLTLHDGKLFGGGGNGNFYALDSKTGEVLWFVNYGASFKSRPVVSASRVYVGSEDGALLALDEQNGRLLWCYRSKGAVQGPVAIANDTVYFGSGDGYVYAVNSTNGRLIWRTRTGAGVQAVASIQDRLLVASLDNFVYLFSLKGKRIWKRQLLGRISAQPLTAADGALFTPLSSSAGVVLGLRDGRPVNSLPTGEEITTSASPIAVGEAVLLTTEHSLLAFSKPRETQQPKTQ